MFDGFEIVLIFSSICLVGLIFLLLKLTGKLKKRDKNAKFPVQSVRASVVSKRTKVKYAYGDRFDVSVPVTRESKTVNITDSGLIYYVTFLVAGKESLELEVNGEDYLTLHEDDIGRLSFQGTRYLRFEKE